MKEIRIQSFPSSDEAVIWIEQEITALVYEGHEDIKAELSLIDGTWRAGVITNSRQGELFESN